MLACCAKSSSEGIDSEGGGERSAVGNGGRGKVYYSVGFLEECVVGGGASAGVESAVYIVGLEMFVEDGGDVRHGGSSWALGYEMDGAWAFWRGGAGGLRPARTLLEVALSGPELS